MISPRELRPERAALAPLPPPPFEYEQRLPRHAEASHLCSVGPDVFGREARLNPETAAAWTAMRTAAAADRVTLQLVSGFRSIERQTEIVLRKIRAGALLEEVLQVNAYPGFSEHHTGRALDIGSPHCAHLTEAFASTPEFTWLERHADEFGFRLSYPRNNALGLIFEPWHWCFGASVNSGEPAPADCRDP